MIPYVGKYKDFEGDTLHILDSYKENGRYVVRYYYSRNGKLFSGFTLSGVVANWWGGLMKEI